MPIFGTLVELYRKRGIEICAGLSPHHFDGMVEANFTWFLKDGKSLTNGLGIAPQEIYLLESLFAVYRPRRVVVIGNSLGWSTLALGLLLPEARVVAIDAGYDENSLLGIDLTNEIAADAKLPVRAVKGVSPGDVNAIIERELGGGIDFAFIDGLHTNEQIVLDYEALAAHASADAVYLFHDVHQFDLYAGISEIEKRSGLSAQRLMATPSGMAIFYDAARHPALAAAAAPFAPAPCVIAVIEQAAWSRRHRRRLRWQRSIAKRLDRLRRLVGAQQR